MKVINATQCRKDLFSILERAVVDNERCEVITKNGNAVIVSEEAWNSLTETLYLMSDPEMLPSIEEAEADYPEGCAEWREWLGSTR